MSVKERWCVGAIVFVAGTCISNERELGRRYGEADAKVMWFPGKVTRCTVQRTALGRNMKYLTATWFLGGSTVKIATTSVGNTKLRQEEGSLLPEAIEELDESVLHRPARPYPRVVVGTEQGVQGPLPDAEDGTNGVPMSQVFDLPVFDLPSDEAVASLPSPTQEVRPSFGCTVHDTEWIEDDEECKLPINGPVRP
jgi:hypothetical protein